MESIQYSLVVKSKDGKQTVAAGDNGSSAANNINTDLTYTANVRQLFNRKSSIHNCNLCKLELVGVLFIAQGVSPNGYDIGVYVNGSMNTIQTTNSPNTEQVIGCHNPMITAVNTKASSGLAYSCPVYIPDLNNVTTLRIILRDSLVGIDIVVGSQYVMNTTQLTSNNAGTTERIIACVNPSLLSNAGVPKLTVNSSEIAYKTPLYIDNINALTYLRIYFRLALTAAKVTSAQTPSYSIELKVTPIMT